MERASLPRGDFKAELEAARALREKDIQTSRQLADEVKNSDGAVPINGEVAALVDRMELRALGWAAYWAGMSAQETADNTK